MVAKLIAEEGLLQGTSFILDDRDEWYIGRDPEVSDIQLEDPAVSRRHLQLRRTSSGFLIENLSTSNPATINGDIIEEATLLKEGDLVKIGDTTFRLSEEDVPQVSPSDSQINDEEHPYDTLFETQEDQSPPPASPHSIFDLTETSRFVLKVVTGPQTGAEFNLELQHPYLIGTDVSSCDIVFHDLSISRQHARLTVISEEECRVEDLNSRNGVLVDGQAIEKQAKVPVQHLVTLGTTSFVIIDREKASETIVSYPAQPAEIKAEEPKAEIPPLAAASVEGPSVASAKAFPFGNLVVKACLIAFCVLLGAGIWSLFETKSVTLPQKDYYSDIQTQLKDFPDVTFNFNKSTGRLFLLGHVLTEVEKSQLRYNLESLKFITSIDDNIIIDEYVWQQINSLLAKNSEWKGIAIHSAAPGRFVVTGYLKTRQEAADLNDYLLMNFNYLDRLDNQVAVEQDLFDKVASDLIQNGFSGVTVDISNGELVLAGFIANNQSNEFDKLLNQWQQLPGIRAVRPFVVKLSPEEAVADLSSKYIVTGTSRVGEETTSVMINTRIYSIGDTIDGYLITRITNNTVFLEKSGLKYKISYNQQ